MTPCRPSQYPGKERTDDFVLRPEQLYYSWPRQARPLIYEVRPKSSIFLILLAISSFARWTVSLLMQVNAINFGLCLNQNRMPLFYAYAALINSLSFPDEIVIIALKTSVATLEYVDEQLTHAPSDCANGQIASTDSCV